MLALGQDVLSHLDSELGTGVDGAQRHLAEQRVAPPVSGLK